MESVEELNLINLECPEPFMKVAAKLMTMKGGTLKVTFKDPKCDEMIIEAVKLMDCKILEHKNDNGVYTLVLEKTRQDTREDKSVKELGSC
jgi:Predicted redox protein, regulator of disulfide bond formation